MDFKILTKDNFILYAMGQYTNPDCRGAGFGAHVFAHAELADGDKARGLCDDDEHLIQQPHADAEEEHPPESPEHGTVAVEAQADRGAAFAEGRECGFLVFHFGRNGWKWTN